MRINIYGLAGPTASGKTEVALALCETLNAEIISCDSVLVYKLLNIGANKPNKQELEKHHLVNMIYPWEAYTAFNYLQDAHSKIQNLATKGKNVLLVGGTMLYFKLLVQGFSYFQCNADLRKSLLLRNRDEIENLIITTAPQLAHKITTLDLRKLIRVAEIVVKSGTSYEEHKAQQQFAPLNIHMCAFYCEDRKPLYELVEERFKKMLNDGLLEEIEYLYKHEKINKESLSMQSIGYKQGWQYMDGQHSYEDFCIKTVIANRHLVKKQLTWLRNWPTKITYINNDLNIMEKTNTCLTHFSF